MMKHKLISLIALLFAALLLFSSCGDIASENKELRTLTDAFMEALLANDAETAYGIMNQKNDKEMFVQNFSEISEFFNGVTSYTLAQTGLHTSIQNGTQTTTVTYSMKTNDEKTYILQAAAIKGEEGLTGIKFQSTDWVMKKSESLSTLRIALLVYSLASAAFCIWMLVDCFKRKLSKKPLWILLILAGIKFAVRFTQAGANIHFSLGIFFSLSGVSTNVTQGLVTATIILPVGAIVYFFLRKRLTKKAVSDENVIEGEAKEISTESENP